MLTLFHSRLRLRGYPLAFLGPVFANAATYDRRAALLPEPVKATPARAHVLVLTFSRAFERLRIARTLHEHLHLLPPHVRDCKTIVAWRLPRKLGGLLATFRYPRLTPRIQNEVGNTDAPSPAGDAVSPT